MIHKIQFSRFSRKAPAPCACDRLAPSRGRLSGFLDSSGTYQDGTNPDPSYGGTLQNPPDAVLGPIDPATGQYTSVYGAQPNTTTPVFPIATTTADKPQAAASFGWLIVAAVGALAVFSVADSGSTKGRRR